MSADKFPYENGDAPIPLEERGYVLDIASQITRWLREKEEREIIEVMAKADRTALLRWRNLIDKALEQ